MHDDWQGKATSSSEGDELVIKKPTKKSQKKGRVIKIDSGKLTSLQT